MRKSKKINAKHPFAGIRSWSGDFRRKACFLADEREDFLVVPVDVLTKGE